MSERALFVIDADGVIRWSYVSPVGVNPGADGILERSSPWQRSGRRMSAIDSDHAAADGAGRRARPRPGLADAPVTLVEYGDYECPFCGAAHPIVKEVQRGSARAALRVPPFPARRSIHPHAQHAAEAAEAAGAQGRFWEMHDMLFEHQERSTSQTWSDTPTLGLDVDRFARELGRARTPPACGRTS